MGFFGYGMGFSVRTRRQRQDVEWKPDLTTDAPTRADDVPARLRHVHLRRGTRSRPAPMPASTWIIIVTVLLAAAGLAWQVLGS